MAQLTDDQKMRLFNGVGNWKSYSAEGLLPSFTMSDGPHGLRKQDEVIDGEHYADLNRSRIATCFPTSSCMAASWDKSLLRELGKTIAEEAQCQDVDLVLGPGTNIKRSPLCGRNFEYFSEDPYLAGTLAAEYINGMQALNVGTSLKHYTCNNQEKRRQTSNSIVSEKTLSEIYLRPFEIAVKKAQPASIMVSYNKVNGEYAAGSKFLLTEILRKKWGFKGLVISDWGACIGAPKCLKAGMSLAMPDSKGYFSHQLKAVYNEDAELREKLDEANRLVIEAAEKWNGGRKGKEQGSQIDFAAHHKAALRFATSAAVLLKNDGILPLAEKSKITVIGGLAASMKFQGGGSSHISTAEYPNALESLKALGYEIDFAEGYPVEIGNRSQAGYQKAIEAAKKAVEEKRPLLFFCGLTEEFEGEGFDRETMALPSVQTKLLDKILELGADVIAVTFSGAPIDIYFADKVRAVLHMYLCGEACGEACAELLSGRVNPSGKIAETFPLSEKDTPCYGSFGGEDDNIEYKEGSQVGYRYYEAKQLPVRYEFGFGLSYTNFAYSSIEVDLQKKTVSFDISNTGSVKGAEAAQVYVQKEGSEYPELRGFEKVELQPGEKKRVTVLLDENSFKSYDSSAHNFIADPGTYKIKVGRSVRKIELEEEVTVDEKTAAILPADAVTVENYSPDENLYQEFFSNTYFEQHHKGSFTTADNLGDMAKESIAVKIILKIILSILLFSMRGKSKDDPSVKIAISAITENPLESLISITNGMFQEKFVNRILRLANSGAKR